jgi:hypothetical protein
MCSKKKLFKKKLCLQLKVSFAINVQTLQIKKSHTHMHIYIKLAETEIVELP